MSWTRRLSIAAFLLVLLWTLLFMCNPIWSLDIWWHIKTGEYILQLGTLPTSSWFSYAYLHNRWINLHWLYQVSQYILYQLGGTTLLILSHSLCITCALLIVIRPLLQQERWLWATFLVFSASLALNQRALTRPEIYSYLFFTIYLTILENYRHQGGRAILWLPLAQLIWVNFQGLFVFGLGLIGIYLLDEAVDRFRNGQAKLFTPLAKTLLYCVLVCFINPESWQGVLYPLTLFNIVSGQDPIWKAIIGEFRPLWTPWPPYTHVTPMYLGFHILLATTIMIFIRWRKQFTLRYVIIYFLFLALAIIARRNLSFFVFVSLLLCARFATPIFDFSSSKRLGSAIGLIVVVGSMIYLLTAQHYYPLVGDARSFGISGIARQRFPQKAAEYILQNSLPGNLFHELDDGGYLLWKLYPRYAVFVDTRLQIMGREHMQRYLTMCSRREYFEKMAREYKINTVLIRSGPIYERIFAGNRHWQPVFFDKREGSLVLKRVR